MAFCFLFGLVGVIWVGWFLASSFPKVSACHADGTCSGSIIHWAYHVSAVLNPFCWPLFWLLDFWVWYDIMLGTCPVLLDPIDPPCWFKKWFESYIGHSGSLHLWPSWPQKKHLPVISSATWAILRTTSKLLSLMPSSTVEIPSVRLSTVTIFSPWLFCRGKMIIFLWCWGYHCGSGYRLWSWPVWFLKYGCTSWGLMDGFLVLMFLHEDFLFLFHCKLNETIISWSSVSWHSINLMCNLHPNLIINTFEEPVLH